MRITAVFDADGTILAAVPTDPDYIGPVPAPPEGTEVEEFDVPDSATEMQLDELCAGFRVDKGEKRLVDHKTST